MTADPEVWVKPLTVHVYYRYWDCWESGVGKGPFVKVGTVTAYANVADADAARRVAEVIFCEWNNGSGQESQAFRRAQIRSLSVGDVVAIDELETTLECGRVGWDVRPALTPEEVGFRHVEGGGPRKAVYLWVPLESPSMS